MKLGKHKFITIKYILYSNVWEIVAHNKNGNICSTLSKTIEISVFDEVMNKMRAPINTHIKWI
jgi:hypothetical protein